jgi:mannose-1-phosphate guanylyltransferase/mannose-6-phosphate isomerase
MSDMAASVSIQPVVLCGGSGTRLWPLSRRAYPKQFVPLIGGRSLLALTLERLAQLADAERGVVCVTGEEHRFLVRDGVAQAGLRAAIVLEPVARNTAAAMALAALRAATGQQLLLFCPADH